MKIYLEKICYLVGIKYVQIVQNLMKSKTKLKYFIKIKNGQKLQKYF